MAWYYVCRPWLTSKYVAWVCQHQLSFFLTPNVEQLLTWDLHWKLNTIWIWKSPTVNDDTDVFHCIPVANLYPTLFILRLFLRPFLPYTQAHKKRCHGHMDTCPPKFWVTWIQGHINQYTNCAQLSEVRNILPVLTRNKDKQTQQHCTNDYC